MKKIRFFKSKILLLLNIFIFLFVLSVVPTRADHLDESAISKGEPEYLLCDINVYKTNLKQAISMFGKPVKIETVGNNDPVESGKPDDKIEGGKYNEYPVANGYRVYSWSFKNLKMELETGFYTDKDSKIIIESGIYVVDVWGTIPVKKKGVTGQGLALGDSYSRVIQIYGNKFQKGRTVDNGKLYLLIQWSDGTQLSIDFDQSEHISHMQLSAKEG